MLLSNPQLAALLNEVVGDGWATEPSRLKALEAYADDAALQDRWRRVKRVNKERLASRIRECTGVVVDPAALFDMQVKRIHEYKRQHLNVLHIITLYQRLLRNPQLALAPRCFVFGGKAAPGYAMAKLIIRLVGGVAAVVNNDPTMGDRLKVVFYPNFNVTQCACHLSCCRPVGADLDRRQGSIGHRQHEVHAERCPYHRYPGRSQCRDPRGGGRARISSSLV